ncbi:hypothetical protein [Spiroplasma endosymbiont of Clivina fossor]|uniref:hypothetical protein n=1 Tax=Spiroplasma endosymbiont of Clivina fossor TaxID=3066282 RepID=UPI00313E764D
MKILNIITLSILTILPIVGCSKKENKSVEQKNKVHDFEIRNLEKVQFWISARKNNLNLYPVTQVAIEKKDNINLNEKLPELKNLNWLIFRFTLEFKDNQSKQDEIRQLITTHGQKIDEDSDNKLWIINKKIAIKAQGTGLDTLNHDNNITNYRLNKTNNFKIEIENP